MTKSKCKQIDNAKVQKSFDLNLAVAALSLFVICVLDFEI